MPNLSPPDEEIPFAQQRLRLKAWARLFVLSEESFEQTAFITQSRDAFDDLSEHYRQTPQQQLTLPLPAFFPEQDYDVMSRRDRFQEEAGDVLSFIRRAATASAKQVFSEKQRKAWDVLLERHYPEAKHGRCILTLYFLPDIKPQQLFFETFAARDGLAAGQKHAETAGTVLGFAEGAEKQGRRPGAEV